MSVPAMRFAYSHSYNNYVKIEFISTRQTKLKKILIKQKDVIRIIFYVNEETRARPSFQELNICQINMLTFSYLCKESKDLHPLQYFLATLKFLTMCMKTVFLNTILKEPDGFLKYVKFLINYRDQKLENCYLITEEKI